MFQSPDGDLGFSSILDVARDMMCSILIGFNPLTGIWVFPPDEELMSRGLETLDEFQSPDGDLGFSSLPVLNGITGGGELTFNPLTGIWVFPPGNHLPDRRNCSTVWTFNPLTGIWVFPPEAGVEMPLLMRHYTFNPLTGIWVFPP